MSDQELRIRALEEKIEALQPKLGIKCCSGKSFNEYFPNIDFIDCSCLDKAKLLM